MQAIKVSGSSNVMLIDMGYLLFYRFHATMKNLKFKGEKDASEEMVTEHFEKHLHEQLKRLHKKYETLIFCKDTPQATIWRKDLYPDYKATRGTATDMIRNLKDKMYKIAEEYGPTLEIDRLEADDVVYMSLESVIKVVDEKTRVFILANDRDYLQAIHKDTIHLVDAGLRKITGTGSSENDVMMKILMGDKSDNIPSICPGVGRKTAEKLAIDPVARAEFITKRNCQENFDRNETLIRFTKIPNMYVEQFKAAYQFI